MSDKKNKGKIDLGTAPVSQLIVQQAVPAGIGIFSVIFYQIVDTIFVGNYIGTNAIAAITVVLPITFLNSSVGMALGVGGASIISRALGANDSERAYHTFGNLNSLIVLFCFLTVTLGYFFANPVLKLFGAQGDVFPLAYTYFFCLLPALPGLAWAMMTNNVIRSEGQPKVAMVAMIIPGIVNIVFDYIFIVKFGWGIWGAGVATAMAYTSSALHNLTFSLTGNSSLSLGKKYLKLKWELVRETFAIGGTTMVRQSIAAVLAIVVNNTLFVYAGEMGIALFGIINRVLMFSMVPVFGLVQGSLPIIGFNYGAKSYDRVKQTMMISLKAGTGFGVIILIIVLAFADQIVGVFSKDPAILEIGGNALRIVFLAIPVVTTQVLGGAYFQGIGKALPALLLTLSRQAFFLIPLILFLPNFLEANGVWTAFPISDTLSTIITLSFLYPQWKLLKTNVEQPLAVSETL